MHHDQFIFSSWLPSPRIELRTLAGYMTDDVPQMFGCKTEQLPLFNTPDYSQTRSLDGTQNCSVGEGEEKILIPLRMQLIFSRRQTHGQFTLLTEIYSYTSYGEDATIINTHV
jgi:hypothetical protein